jgi:hypothetical protein
MSTSYRTTLIVPNPAPEVYAAVSKPQGLVV